MDISKYLKILGLKKPLWFFSNDNHEKRLNALSKILENVSPKSIHSLIPYLRDRDREIQSVTCNTIVGLFARIKTKKGYYEALKHCDISPSDIDLYENAFAREQFIILLSIASLNRSGYVREKAVQRLSISNNEKAIQFIIYRLADWVPVVRQSALEGIANFKKPGHINAFVENLSIFEGLQKVERINLGPVYDGIINFILTENRDYVHKNFISFKEKSRLLLAKRISSSANADLNDVRLLLNDKHFLIRNLAIDHFDKLSQEEIANLLDDKSSKVRLNLLHKLQSQSDISGLVHSILADDSTSIREFARYYLKDEITDFATIYNDNLKENRKIFGSICGLGETDGKQFFGNVERFLHSGTIKIRKTAFLALTKLDEKTAYEFAIANLDSEYAGVRNLVIRFLQKKVNIEVVERARDIYKNGNLDLKKAMLKLFSNIGGWAAISDILIGTIDENEDIRNLSLGYLHTWRAKAVRLFSQPKLDEIERAKKIFSFALKEHEDKNYFEENPLKGLEFYLR